MTRKRVHWGQTPFRVKDDPEIGQLSADLTNNGGQTDPALGHIPRQVDWFPGHRWPGMEFGPNGPFPGQFLTRVFLECSVLFFQDKFYASTLILLRDMLGIRHHDIPLTSVEMTDTFCFFCKKCHFCHLLLFAKVGQYYLEGHWDMQFEGTRPDAIDSAWLPVVNSRPEILTRKKQTSSSIVYALFLFGWNFSIDAIYACQDSHQGNSPLGHSCTNATPTRATS